MAAKYIRLADALRSAIMQNNELNYKLPTEASLCKRYNVSRQTVRTALALLESEGLITRRQGSGSYASRIERKASKNLIAILLPSDSEHIYPKLISDIDKKLAENNLKSVIYVTDNDPGTERNILTSLLNSDVTGIIAEGCLSSHPTANKDLYDRLSSMNISIIFINCGYPNLPEYPVIKDNNYNGGYYAAKYLIDHGHRNIAGIYMTNDSRSSERYYGMTCAMRDSGIAFTDNNILWFSKEDYHNLQKSSDYGFLSEFIKKTLRYCSSVVCCNDEIAYWLVKALKDSDLTVPEDISLICFESSYLSKLGSTPVTSLSHTPNELAGTIVKQLIRNITGHAVLSVQLEMHLSDKGSVRSL